MLGYTPGSDLGYALGVAGALMMLALLLYPLRKRIPALQRLGPLPWWFRMHMAFGLGGPALILAHSQLRVGSPNAAVALFCMLLVAASGVVGRFIYRQIHHGLYGRRASLAELSASLEANAPVRGLAPEVQRKLLAFEALAARRGGAWPVRAWRFATLPLRERAAFEECRRELRRAFRRLAHAGVDRRDVGRRYVQAKRLVAERLRLARAAAHFAAYERMFALWHVLHVPFVWMLVASAAVHVIAVHMY